MTETKIENDGIRAVIRSFGAKDHISRIIIESGQFYEIDLLRRAREFYLPNTIVVDVGANIGNHTLYFALALDAEVYAFEPYKISFELLKQNIEINLLASKVHAYHQAVGKQKSKAHVINPTLNNIGQAKIEISDSGEVSVCALDDFEFDSAVGIIKIDVEGTEIDVIVGAKRTILKYKPIVFVEAATYDAFKAVAQIFYSLDYAPVGRYGFTPTYLFAPIDGRSRIRSMFRTSIKTRMSQRFSNFLRIFRKIEFRNRFNHLNSFKFKSLWEKK